MPETEGLPGATGTASAGPDGGTRAEAGAAHSGPTKGPEHGGGPKTAEAPAPPPEAPADIPPGSVVLGGAEAPESEIDSRRTERGRAISEELILQKLNDIPAELQRDNRTANADETTLLWYDMYQNGFNNLDTPGSTMAIPQEFGGKLEVPTDKYGTVIVTSLTDPSEGPDGIEYTCTMVGKTGTIKLSGAELAAAHMKQNAVSFANNFPDASERRLVDWYANGGEGNPPLNDEQLRDMEDAKKPEVKANKALTEQKAYLAGREQAILHELQRYAENDPRRGEVQSRLDAVQNVIAQVDRAQGLTEGRLLLFAKENALRGAQKYAEQQGDSQASGQAKVAMESLKPELAREQDEFKAYLKEHGVPDDVLKLADNPDNFAALMARPEIANLPDVAKELFGTDLAGAQNILNDFIDNSSIPDELKGHLKDMAKRGGKGAFWAILILLATGAGLVVAGAVGAVKAGSAIAGEGGR